LTNWRKYEFVCDPHTCDSVLELTVKDGEFKFPNGVAEITCPCGRQMQCISANLVVQEQKKEEAPTVEATTTYLDQMITALQEQVERKDALIESLQKQLANSDYWKSENGRVQSQIIDVIDELYAGNWTNVDDIANSLCQIIDYSPTKEIEFTATMSFSGKIQVPANEDFDLEDILSEAYVDINHGDVVIDSCELYDANEC
jgi:hypothetical protein